MFLCRRYLVIIIFFIGPVSASASEKLAYYSDYFSFIGRDTNGYVAFALDNNRGVDGSRYQAEHFGVLYNEISGWVKLLGTGEYENVPGELERIPNSPHFTFEGVPDTGMVVTSDKNGLSLQIGPVVTQLTEKRNKRSQRWGVANGVLLWSGRKIQGRVIHEHLIRRDWNRLTRTCAGTWDNFQGFYLVVQTGTINTWRDLYLRSEGKGDTRRTRGFVLVDEWSGTIHVTQFVAFDKAFNWGFYRWPQKWVMKIQLDSAKDTPQAGLSLRQISRKNQSNWVIGGFAMTLVEGELHLNGKVLSVLGFAELIK